MEFSVLKNACSELIIVISLRIIIGTHAFADKELLTYYFSSVQISSLLVVKQEKRLMILLRKYGLQSLTAWKKTIKHSCC